MYSALGLVPAARAGQRVAESGDGPVDEVRTLPVASPFGDQHNSTNSALLGAAYRTTSADVLPVPVPGDDRQQFCQPIRSGDALWHPFRIR